MDSDSFIPQFWKAQRILGLEKLTVKIIETAGIRLKELTEEQGINAIGWLNKGKLVEFISGWSHEAEHILTIVVSALKSEVALRLESNETEGAQILAIARADERGETRAKILDTTGASDFLRLILGSPVHHGEFNMGKIEFGIEAGSTLSNVETIEHELEHTPYLVHAFVWAQIGANYSIVFEVRPILVNEFFVDLQAIASSPIPGAVPIFFTVAWFAIS